MIYNANVIKKMIFVLCWGIIFFIMSRNKEERYILLPKSSLATIGILKGNNNASSERENNGLLIFSKNNLFAIISYKKQ